MRYETVLAGQIKALALTILIALTGCGKAPEPLPDAPARPIKMAVVGDEKARSTREYPGVITAAQTVKLGFEVPGRIVELPITEGQKINAGEMLAKLDPRDYLAARDAAKSNYVTMESVYKRAKRIYDQQAGSQAEVDLALRDLDIAREELRKAQKALEDTVLLSPFNGEIGKKLVDNFQNVQAKEPVLLLHNVQQLEVDITVPEQDFVSADTAVGLEERTARLNPTVVLSTLPDRDFKARFVSFSSAADPVTRSYTVTLAFDNPDALNIRPGMTAKVVLHMAAIQSGEAGSSFMLPVSAVAVEPDNRAYVWKVDPQTAQVTRVPVSVGPMLGAAIQVSGPLKPGDRVAAAGIHHLREGMEVYPLEAE
ncbi:efflux RND transporter periplasmic adaptor subunit [Porticoccus sp.]